MNASKTPRMDRFAVALTGWMTQRKWLVLVVVPLIAIAIASGAQRLSFASNYRVFFSKENPELMAFEEFQNVYTKNDNFLFVLQPKDGKVFSPATAEAMERLTEEAWQIPFAIRVDSLSNFQHTWSQEDDLIVEDLIVNGASLTQETLDEKESIALAEPLLKDNLIAADARTAGVNVVLQYPEKELSEVPMATKKAREIADTIRAAYPDLHVGITGISMLNNSFAESGIKDLSSLVPMIYLALIVVMILTLRSWGGTLATLAVILLSTITAMGFAGWAGIQLTPISMTAPTIILTLAIADSVHIIISMRAAMREGAKKLQAITESLRVNFVPVTITSLTTVVGFLALNFSDAPPFWHLGNITAVGIAAAWLYSITLLPAFLAILPIRFQQTSASESAVMDRLADWVVGRYRTILATIGVAAVAIAAMAPTVQLNDEWTKYFTKAVPFRVDTDFALENLGGLYPIEFSLTAEGPEGISDPEYLEALEAFTQWLREREEVVHVYSYTDIIKRLNKNLHSDDDAYYRIPEDRQLAAQYLLLYELSLRQGLDLNDRINIDKSATRLTATVGDVSTVQTRVFVKEAEAWLKENTPEYMWAAPTGATVMFSYVAKRNIESMLTGNVIAIVLISAIMMVALRSVRLGALSLIPNAFPILMTFGLWAALVGLVGMAAATVTATSLGIIVDDTVHFLSKYLRGIREKGLSTPEAIRYAFHTVGSALWVNSVILVMGFGVLAFSTFRINYEMGLLTAIAVAFALLFDFLILPSLLMLGAKSKSPSSSEGQASQPQLETQNATA